MRLTEIMHRRRIGRCLTMTVKKVTSQATKIQARGVALWITILISQSTILDQIDRNILEIIDGLSCSF